MTKRYYWLKLPEDFFRQKTIKKLRKIAGGDTYTVIYLKMLLIAMKNDGKIFFDGVEDEFFDELALDLDEDSENVKVTVLFLVRQGLMELVDETEYLLKECGKMVGSESASAQRVREHRERKLLQSNADVTVSNKMVTERRDREEIEKDVEIDNTICSELESSKQEEEVFISLPLVTGSGAFDVTFDYLNSLRSLYPGIDIEQEFRKMFGWLDSNPRNRKTQRGIKRFITGWLSRAQDKAPVCRGTSYGGYVQPKNMTTEQYMQSTADWYEGIGDINDTSGI